MYMSDLRNLSESTKFRTQFPVYPTQMTDDMQFCVEFFFCDVHTYIRIYKNIYT